MSEDYHVFCMDCGERLTLGKSQRIFDDRLKQDGFVPFPDNASHTPSSELAACGALGLKDYQPYRTVNGFLPKQSMGACSMAKRPNAAVHPRSAIIKIATL